MATTLRRTSPMSAYLRDSNNLIKKQIGAGSSVHMDAAETARQVSAADATNLATSLTLVNDIRAKYNLHIGADNAGAGMAHLIVDATNTISAPIATDLTTAEALANEIKADYNAHRSQAGVHPNDDSGHAIAAADATDQTTLNTLLNEIKTDFNLHMADAPTNVAPSIRLVDA